MDKGCAVPQPLCQASVYLQRSFSPRQFGKHKIARLRRQPVLQQLRQPLPHLLQRVPPDFQVPSRALGKTYNEGDWKM